MKTIGIVILLAIFLAGSYTMGRHQDINPYLHKIDSLQQIIQVERITNSRLNKYIDTLKLQHLKHKQLTSSSSKKRS